VANGIRVDSSFCCQIRTQSTLVSAQGTAPAQRVPDNVLPGRRLLRILNAGGIDEKGNRVNVPVVIGNADAKWGSSPSQISGFPLHLEEFVDLPIDDSIPTFAVTAHYALALPADLRTIELR
jgi:hypothetical protein